MRSIDRSPPRRFLVIRNPMAGRRQRGVLDAVLAILRRHGAVADVVDTTARGDARRLSHTADAAGHDAIVAAGGDGTINEVVNGLLARSADDLALGIIALGTANVLAREIGLNTRPESLAQALLAGRPTAMVPGQLTDASGARSCFVLMVGAGFDAHVVARVDEGMKRRLGKGAYVWRSLAEMVRYRDRRYRIEIDGVACHDAASVIVSKGRLYGGPYIVAPAADLCRPILSVCLFERGGRLQVARYGLALLAGRLPSAAGYRIVEARRVRITAIAGPLDEPEPIQVDGDHTASLPVEVALAPRPVRLLMPQA